MALLEIVEGDDLIAAGEENFRADAADVACCSGYENVQGMTSPLSKECVVRFSLILKLSVRRGRGKPGPYKRTGEVASLKGEARVGLWRGHAALES